MLIDVEYSPTKKEVALRDFIGIYLTYLALNPTFIVGWQLHGDSKGMWGIKLAFSETSALPSSRAA